MTIPVKDISQWEERVSQLTPGETARMLAIYETTLVTICGSHHALIEALRSCDLTDEVAGVLAGWTNKHAALIEDVNALITHIATEPGERLH